MIRYKMFTLQCPGLKLSLRHQWQVMMSLNYVQREKPAGLLSDFDSQEVPYKVEI